MKSIGVVRKVDALGRIVLPKDLRDRMDLNGGTKYELSIDGECIVIDKYIPKCTICEEKSEDITYFKDRPVCKKCIEELK